MNVKANTVLARKLAAQPRNPDAVKNAQANLEYHVFSYFMNERIKPFHSRGHAPVGAAAALADGAVAGQGAVCCGCGS